LNPDLALPYAVRGTVAQDQSNWAYAIEQLNAAISRDPSNSNTWYFRGGVWMGSGYFDAAAEDFEACLQRDPDYAICRRYLAFTELYRGNTDRALELFEAGILEGQNSHLQIMTPVYFASGDERAALLYLAYVTEATDGALNREVNYHYYSDHSLSNESITQLTRSAYLRENGTLNGFVIPDLEYTEPLPTVSNSGLIWNPFETDRFRPASRDAYLAARRAVIIEMRLPEFWRANGFPPQCHPVDDDDFECGWIDGTD